MNIAELITIIRGYTGFEDPEVQTDAMITGWVRQGEETINSALRCADMVQIDTGEIVEGRVTMPSDWQYNDFVRIVDDKPILYLPRDMFYDGRKTNGYYTMSGKIMMVGGNPTADNPKNVELHYFGDVPRTDGPTWLSLRYPTILINATMVFASAQMVEDTRVPGWKAEMNERITKLNDEYRASRGSGSVVTTRPRRRN